MKKKYTLFTLLCCVIIYAQPKNIRGYIKLNNTPIPNAQVTIHDTSDNSVLANVLTNSDGYFNAFIHKESLTDYYDFTVVTNGVVLIDRSQKAYQAGQIITLRVDPNDSSAQVLLEYKKIIDSLNIQIDDLTAKNTHDQAKIKALKDLLSKTIKDRDEMQKDSADKSSRLRDALTNLEKITVTYNELVKANKETNEKNDQLTSDNAKLEADNTKLKDSLNNIHITDNFKIADYNCDGFDKKNLKFTVNIVDKDLKKITQERTDVFVISVTKLTSLRGNEQFIETVDSTFNVEKIVKFPTDTIAIHFKAMRNEFYSDNTFNAANYKIHISHKEHARDLFGIGGLSLNDLSEDCRPRQNIKTNILSISSNNVELEIFDQSGDNDKITVTLNGKEVLRNYVVTNVPKRLPLVLIPNFHNIVKVTNRGNGDDRHVNTCQIMVRGQHQSFAPIKFETVKVNEYQIIELVN